MKSVGENGARKRDVSMSGIVCEKVSKRKVLKFSKGQQIFFNSGLMFF